MGEYVSLGKVEACLKIHPLIDNICVIADSSKTYCVALVVPDMARLTELAIQLELCLGYKELCENPLVIESITGQLQSHAKETLQKFEIPQKFALISNPWTPDTGLVTSSMKLKRKAIQARYFDIIHQLYQNSPSKSKTNWPPCWIELTRTVKKRSHSFIHCIYDIRYTIVVIKNS